MEAMITSDQQRIVQLEETIAAFVVEIDKAMKGSSTHARGQKIARLVGALQGVGLGLDDEHGEPEETVNERD